jgi:transposase-like protein
MTNTMICKRGRPPGLTANRMAKRYIIAGALLAGITVAAVARQLGVSRSWASREANAPGTRLLISELFEANRERINAVLDRTLDVIEAAFEVRCTLVVRGALVDAGPDHYARLEAAKLVLRMLSSRR